MSRATHDRELAALERLLGLAEQRADDSKAEGEAALRLHETERRRYDELLQTVLAMKAQGAQVVPTASGVVTWPPPLPNDPLAKLKALIAEKAGANFTLRGLMLRQLELDYKKQVPLDEIEANILSGTESDGVPA